ncbi:MAG TPA: GtrA family protein [Xanthobacteraceae bacterium]|nr:GtrA family protein [Xanthobacteraceae bacterium]
MKSAPRSVPLSQRLFDRLATAWDERAIILKAASFAVVGAVNTAIDAGVFFLALWALVGSPSRAGTVTLIAANVFSWSVAVSGSYVMNSFVTFAAESGRQLRLKAYATFVAGGILGAIGNTTALVVVAQFAPVLVAKACAIVVSFVLNFSMSHFVVFRARHPKPGRAARPS